MKHAKKTMLHDSCFMIHENSSSSSSNRVTILLMLLIAVGAFLRLYNLNWGSPFYFHPDERNIASTISQLHFPSQLNPHFFAYGSLPLYLIYFLGLTQNFFTTCHFSFACPVPFEQAIILSRLISSFLSTLLIPISFVVSEKLKKGTGLLTAALVCFSAGFIQFAHFGTVEIILSFFSLLLFYGAICSVESWSLRWSLFSGIILGLLISTKVSSLVLVVIPFIVYAISGRYSLRQKSLQGFGLLLLQIGIAGVLLILTNPFILLATTEFKNSMHYESSVGFGTLPVFYTSEFIDSIPVVFQLLHVYPFLSNPVILCAFLGSCIFLTTKIKNKKIFLLLFFFLLLFLSQAFLFVKWTRYMVPTLPFIYLSVSLFLTSLHSLRKPLISICILASMVFGVSFFITTYIEKDTRLQALDFAKKTIPSKTPILSEVYDLGIVPFNSHYPAITLFNSYELDNRNPEFTWDTLTAQLQNTDVIILPSQRIIKTRMQHPKMFPVANKFYQQLSDNELGFKQVYQTPCSLFCQITYLGDPAERFEQTATVFDHPTVFVYRK